MVHPQFSNKELVTRITCSLVVRNRPNQTCFFIGLIPAVQLIHLLEYMSSPKSSVLKSYIDVIRAPIYLVIDILRNIILSLPIT